MTIYIYSPKGEFTTSEERWVVVVQDVEPGSYLIDTHYSENEAGFRYGMAIRRQWQYTLFSEFPPEFKTYLLLLGVK